jgi:hypothetical protein
MPKMIFLFSLIIFVSEIKSHVFFGISTGTYTNNLSIGGFGLGYRIGKFSPNLNCTFNSYFDRSKINGKEQNDNDIEIVPQIGIDYSLYNKKVELFIPFQIGTYFWQLPSSLNYSFFTELGIGAQKQIESLEVGGNVGVYYRVVNYDENDNYKFSNHQISQYVKIHIRYYLKKLNE